MLPVRHLRALCACLLLTFTSAATAIANPAGNGRLQVIHLDVGQGDGAVIITPLGQVVMIDDGVSTNPTPAMGVKVPAQLQALGITHVDYHFASHYHADHIGLFTNIFGTTAANGVGGIASLDWAFDRGGSYTTQNYTAYAASSAPKRRTILKGQVITLDSLSAHPVYIKCVDLAGCGLSTSDENSLCLALRLSYGEFDESFDGDLQGSTTGGGVDCETIVKTEEQPVEVYKVHHHGSKYSTNDGWLTAMAPKVAVISCGTGNTYGHPTSDALGRLHNHGVKTYWTETGAGVAPLAGWDKVANGQIRISATWEGAGVDTISGNGFADTFINSGTPPVDATAPLANIVSPDGGETWKAGSTQSITWTASDNVGVSGVDLAWSSDGGINWSPIATGIANTGSYAWTLPAQATTTGLVRVRAHDAAGNLGADSSSAGFTVDYWTVTATAGLGGSITPAGIVNVVQGGSSSFAIAPAAGCQVQGVLVDGAQQGAVTSYQFTGVNAYHTVAASFLDTTSPVITLSSPDGGEQLVPGDPFTITWSATDNLGVDSVDVDISLAGAGGPWSALAHGLPNTGTWSWTVPSDPTDDALVRVTAYDRQRNSGVATSDSVFAIESGNAGVAAGPARLALAPPAPNPAAGAVGLHFSLPADGVASIEVLDVGGRRVGQYGGSFSAGSHSWTWDGRNASGSPAGAGLYLVRLHTAQGVRTQRLVLLR